MLIRRKQSRHKNVHVYTSFNSSNHQKVRPSLSQHKKWSLLKFHLSGAKRERLNKIIWTSLGFFGVVFFVGAVAFLFYLQSITKEIEGLAENPFKDTASSTITDRNGKVLYKVSPSDYERDLLGKDEYVPDTLKWAILSAEDEEFYQHPGFDVTAIVRCAVKNLYSKETCGGSTITQQVIKNTVLIKEDRSVQTKIKELILAMQLERLNSKDQILNIYFNIVPQGSRVLGVKRGADFYFKKNLKDLSLEEIIVVAAVGQNPNLLSPTVGGDVEANRKRLYDRADYIVGQMTENIDKINERIKISNEKNKNQDPEKYPKQEELTIDRLNQVKENVRKLEYQKSVVDFKAPHFVFYVQKLLQERDYNNGKPFTTSEIETGGYQITTTLDLSLQEVAEEYVSSDEPSHAGFYRKKFDGRNSALMTLRPSTGEILTMVGSKCFNDSNPYIPNCSELDEKEGTLFDPNVNILDTLQSPGSTNKALGYYVAFDKGIVSAGSYLPDVPIQIGTYKPKNWNGAFSGMYDVRSALAESINLPPLFLIQTYGVQSYIDAARAFGYTTYTNPDGYGPSVVIGGTDVKGIEHAQAFGVFANGGDYVRHEVILKITDIYGNVVYEHKPEKKRVANPEAIYMVNNILNPRYTAKAPTKSLKNRDVAGKTGTSENNRDNWFVMWSPEFVTVAWQGNNDNTRMNDDSFGSMAVEPWVGAYMTKISSEFPPTPFIRPAGIVTASGCSDDKSNTGSTSGTQDSAESLCLSKADIAIAGKSAPGYLQMKTVPVCIDQPDRKARDIDIASGFAQYKQFKYLQSPVPNLQGFVDAFFESKGEWPPTKECDIDRFNDPNKPDGVIISPQPGQSYNGQIPVEARAFAPQGRSISSLEFYLDGDLIGKSSSDKFQQTIDISGKGSGRSDFTMKIVDSKGSETSKSFNITIGDAQEDSYTLDLSSAATETQASSPVQLNAKFSGRKSPRSIEVYQVNETTGITSYVGEMESYDSDTYTLNWVSSIPGKYRVYAVANMEKTSISSSTINVSVIDVKVTPTASPSATNRVQD